MQEPTKKRLTEKAEARFVGNPEDILKFRRLAKEYHLEDVTDLQESLNDIQRALHSLQEESDKTFRVEEVFPELLHNAGGVALRGYRCREGLTQKGLAQITGISQHHISEMENGKCSIGKERAKKLAMALKCDYRRFL